MSGVGLIMSGVGFRRQGNHKGCPYGSRGDGVSGGAGFA